MKQANRKMNREDAEARSGAYLLRLFVAGEEANSKQARENLMKICEEHLKGDYKIEVVDVLNDFEAALKSNILLTPALVVVSASPPVTIFGNLSDTEKVLSTLGLTGGKS
jgi:circadian clock protein KaiB